MKNVPSDAKKFSDNKKLVFLDTEVFDHQNFQFSFGLLAILSQQVKSERVELILTDVTINEIESHIKREVEKAFSAIQSLRDKGRILRNSNVPNIAHFFKTHKKKRIYNDLRKQFKSYIDDTKATILEVNTIKPSLVFDRYFNTLPPFSDKKKKEFPDAFALEALNLHCTNNKMNLIVISDDSDWVDACEDYGFIHYNRLEEFLQSIQEETELFQTARDFLTSILPERSRTRIEIINSERKEDTVETSEFEKFIHEEFKSLGFFVADRDAIITDVKIDNTFVNGYHIVNATPNEITFSIDVSISFTASLEYLSGRNIPDHISEFYMRRSPFSDLGEPNEVHDYISISFVGTINWDSQKNRLIDVLSLNKAGTKDIHVYVENYYES